MVLPAGVAQLAEQLICNQQVVGSSPSASSSMVVSVKLGECGGFGIGRVCESIGARHGEWPWRMAGAVAPCVR